MFYKTEKNTATGLKFQKLVEKIIKARDEQMQLVEKYEIMSYRRAFWKAAGGFSAVIFASDFEVDKSIWKNVNNSHREWMPKLNTKKGKAIQKEFDSMFTVTKGDVNECIGWDEEFSRKIGFCSTHDTLFGYETESNWNCPVPSDCIEITETEYWDLFDNKTPSHVL